MALTKHQKIRVLIGDSAGAVFNNDELDFFLEQASDNLFEAAQFACMAIATSTAKSAVAFTVNGLNINKSQIPQHYMSLSDKYKDAARTGMVPRSILHQLDYHVDEFGRDRGEVYGDTYFGDNADDLES